MPQPISEEENATVQVDVGVWWTMTTTRAVMAIQQNDIGALETANQYRAAGKYSMKTPYRLFGRWQLALAAAGLKPGNPRKLGPLPRGPRTIPASLRYRVLLRDNFRCVACGGSPANNVNAKLEVDHIHPWSRGGATRMENLRTLCGTCNRGKSGRVDPIALEPLNRPEADL